MDIATGSTLVVILNRKDAKKYDLHSLDRVKIKKGRKIETAVLNIAESEKAVPVGRIGVYEEVLKSLKLKKNDPVEITPARKPLSISSIRKKLDGKPLSRKEIHQIVWDIVHNKLSAIELTYFVAAGYMRKLSLDETIWLTKEISAHGSILRLKRYPIIDKHSIGGVPGNRTTMILVPIIAAAGLTIPKTSSRSITSPAGTADTMEVLAKVVFSIKEMKKIVEKTNGCIVWGGSLNLAPADDKIIRVEKPMGIDAESQLLASIMAKKQSVSSTHILIDIPVGEDSKVKNGHAARNLKKDFEIIGKRLRKTIKVCITDGSQPIGNGIGPALEAIDVLHVLRNDKEAPSDLKKKSIKMAGLILEMAKKARKGEGQKLALKILDSGKAYEKMKEIIKAQKGNVFDPGKIRLGKFTYDFKSKKAGKVKDVDNNVISKIARIAGAPENKGAGLYLYKHIGDRVKKNETLFKIYAGSQNKLEYAIDTAKTLRSYLVK